MFKTFTSNFTVIIWTDKVKRKWKIFHKDSKKMSKYTWCDTVLCIEMMMFPSCKYFSSLRVVNIFSTYSICVCICRCTRSKVNSSHCLHCLTPKKDFIVFCLLLLICLVLN